MRLVRRGLKLLANVGALRIETRSGRTNLLVPLLAGSPLYDTTETKGEVRTAASATPDADVRPTPDATVRGPRTPASYESSYLKPHIENLYTDAPPYPPLGKGEGEKPTVSRPYGSWKDTNYQQQAAPHQASGYPNGSQPEGSNRTRSHEQATEPIVEGEILPPDDAPTFERFWSACAEPRGQLGFALAEWRKLSSDEQQRAYKRPSRNGTWAGSWLRGRMFDLPPNLVEGEHHIGRRTVGRSLSSKVHQLSLRSIFSVLFVINSDLKKQEQTWTTRTWKKTGSIGPTQW